MANWDDQSVLIGYRIFIGQGQGKLIPVNNVVIDGITEWTTVFPVRIRRSYLPEIGIIPITLCCTTGIAESLEVTEII